MEHKGRNFFDAKIIFGLFIIAAGALMLADNFGYYTGFSVWDWWPIILIAIGVGQLAQPNESRQLISGIFLVVIGGMFLGDNLRLIRFDFWDIWPIILIFVGVMILRNHVWAKKSSHDDVSFINLFFFLGGGDHSYASHELSGGSLTAMMGGGTVDLRESKITGDTLVIDAFVLWGGIEIIVPKNWKVNVQGMPIMGGIENKTSTSIVKENGTEPGKVEKQIVIKGMVIMGGLEVKN